MTEIRGKHYVEARLPCHCPARAYWSEENGKRQGHGTRYCRKHRLAFHFSMTWFTMTHGPTIPELSGETADAYIITWTNLERYRAELAATAKAMREKRREGIARHEQELAEAERERDEAPVDPTVRPVGSYPWGDRADWMEVDGRRISREEMDREIEEMKGH